MSQKKRKKRRTQSSYHAGSRQWQDQPTDSQVNYEKKLNPVTRNLLLLDLVLLAVVGLLSNNGLISDTLSAILSLVGIVVMVVALWFQFGRTGTSSGGGGRLSGGPR